MFDQEQTPAAPRSLVAADIIAQATADQDTTKEGNTPAATQTGAANAAAPVPAVDYNAAASDLVETAGVLFFPAFPSMQAVYPAPVRAAIAAALAPVLKKYKVDMLNLPPEIALAIVVLPTIPAAMAAYRKDKGHNDQAQTQSTQSGAAGIDAAASIIVQANGSAPPPGAENPLRRFKGL